MVNLIKMKCADHRFGLQYKPKKRIIDGLLVGGGKKEWLGLKEESLKRKSWKSFHLVFHSQKLHM